MKFWQKAFIGILIVFILSINICLYLTSRYSFSLNLDRDTDRGLGEYHFITGGIKEALENIYYREQAGPSQASVESVMRPYADYYRKQNVFLELRHSDKILFTDTPPLYVPGISGNGPENGTYEIRVVSNNIKNYLHITGKIGGLYPDYTLTYIRDLSELYNAHTRLTRYLILVSVLVEVALTLVLLLFLRKLTSPIVILQKATREIAGGVYDGRVNIPGRDEFHDLAENFNQMASSIQEKITQLDKNAQDKQHLIDNLAHELRTPLTAIRGYAEYLQNASTNEENRIKASAYIISETDRMKNLAFKLLDLALVRHGNLELQQIRPPELFGRVGSALEAKLKEKQIELEFCCSLNELQGDYSLLQSLLVNLVDNAVKASGIASSIRLSAYFDEAPVLEVKDSGCGMEKDQIALVCEPFYRVDKARSRSSGGIGLGLSLCREIAHLHGAGLEIHSLPGTGTTVRIIFTTPLQLSENSMTHMDV